jgi:hypothetical protein
MGESNASFLSPESDSIMILSKVVYSGVNNSSKMILNYNCLLADLHGRKGGKEVPLPRYFGCECGKQESFDLSLRFCIEELSSFPHYSY